MTSPLVYSMYNYVVVDDELVERSSYADSQQFSFSVSVFDETNIATNGCAYSYALVDESTDPIIISDFSSVNADLQSFNIWLLDLDLVFTVRDFHVLATLTSPSGFDMSV